MQPTVLGGVAGCFVWDSGPSEVMRTLLDALAPGP
jgi:hypothetical protein